MLRRSAAHIGRQQNMIFGDGATGDQHGGDGDDIAQGNAFSQQRPVHFQQLAVIQRRTQILCRAVPLTPNGYAIA